MNHRGVKRFQAAIIAELKINTKTLTQAGLRRYAVRPMTSTRQQRSRAGRLGPTRSDLVAKSVAGWGSIMHKEQERFYTLADEHKHESHYCASLVAHVREGNRITSNQASTLMKMATDRGWRIPVVSTKKK
jgi:hypothetical protein